MPRSRDLSDEQKRILGFVAKGWTDERIARELKLGVRTVRRRLREAADLMGVKSRIQLALEASRRGLLKGLERVDPGLAANGHDSKQDREPPSPNQES